jgi:hypothetical protein
VANARYRAKFEVIRERSADFEIGREPMAIHGRAELVSTR